MEKQEQVQLPVEFDKVVCAGRDILVGVATGKFDFGKDLGIVVGVLQNVGTVVSQVKAEPFRCAKSFALRAIETVQLITGFVEPA